MDKDTIARLRGLFEKFRSSRDIKTLQPFTPEELRNYLPALLSIAERAADVEGMARVMPELWTRENGFATPKEQATAVSRYALGGE